MTAPNQLGKFLRTRRSRLHPSDVGLPSGVGLRRTPSTTAHLRALEADHPGDQDLRELIAELLEGSPEFARLWRRHDVRHRRGDRKPFRHPQVGEFTLTFEVLYLEGGQIYQAEPGSRDHDAMTLPSMIASGGQTPGRLPSPGRPPA